MIGKSLGFELGEGESGPDLVAQGQKYEVIRMQHADQPVVSTRRMTRLGQLEFLKQQITQLKSG